MMKAVRTCLPIQSCQFELIHGRPLCQVQLRSTLCNHQLIRLQSYRLLRIICKIDDSFFHKSLSFSGSGGRITIVAFLLNVQLLLFHGQPAFQCKALWLRRNLNSVSIKVRSERNLQESFEFKPQVSCCCHPLVWGQEYEARLAAVVLVAVAGPQGCAALVEILLLFVRERPIASSGG